MSNVKDEIGEGDLNDPFPSILSLAYTTRRSQPFPPLPLMTVLAVSVGSAISLCYVR